MSIADKASSAAFGVGSFEVVAYHAEVHALASEESALVARLPKGTKVKVENIEGSRGMLTEPTYGWISFEAKDGNSILKPASEKEQLAEKKPSLAKLARILLANLELKDRTYLFQTYKKCFVGKEAITWMVQEQYARNRKHALQLLNKLNRLGVVEHVVKDHVVKDEYLFYFMNEEKIVNKQNEADPRKNIEETMDMLSKELQVLLVSKRQAVCDEKFAEAAHIQEHIEAMRVRLGEFYEQAISSRESIVEEIAPIIGSSNQDRSSQPKFSPTDFFSVSPESDISASVDSRPRLRRGERITISRIDQLEASKATLVRRKKGIPEQWYVLYDDGRCELHDLTKVRYTVISDAVVPEREGSRNFSHTLYVPFMSNFHSCLGSLPTGGTERNKATEDQKCIRKSEATKCESNEGKISMKGQSHFKMPQEMDGNPNTLESVTSSLREFSVEERDLGDEAPDKPRERSGRFSNTQSFLESEFSTSIPERSLDGRQHCISAEIKSSFKGNMRAEMEASDSFLIGGMNSTIEAPRCDIPSLSAPAEPENKSSRKDEEEKDKTQRTEVKCKASKFMSEDSQAILQKQLEKLQNLQEIAVEESG